MLRRRKRNNPKMVEQEGEINMVNITFSIDETTHHEMRQYAYFKWSSFLRDKIKEQLELMEKQMVE